MMRARVLWVVVLAVGMLGEASARSEAGTISQSEGISGEAMLRARADGSPSLLFGMTTPSAMQIDEVRLRGVGSFKFRSGLVPDGWTAVQDGSEILMKVEPGRLPAELPSAGTGTRDLRFRLDLAGGGRDRLYRRLDGRKLTARAFRNDRKLFDMKLEVSVQPRVVVEDRLDGALVVPRHIVSGQAFFASAEKGYREGKWELGDASGVKWFALRDEQPATESIGSRWTKALDEENRRRTAQGAGAAVGKHPAAVDEYRFATADDARPGTAPAFRYTDEWGDTRVLALATGTIITPPARDACTPSIATGSPMVFAGQTLCMTGCFPDVPVFLLNDMQPLYPKAGSPTAIEVHIPPDAVPGPHTATLAGDGGAFPFTVLGMSGSIDQDLLWQGQSTKLRIEILGTDQSLPVEIINRTPGIIAVEGGEQEFANSSGGSPNTLERDVNGINRGNFSIIVRLENASCDVPVD